jgi:hypothetical protein
MSPRTDLDYSASYGGVKPIAANAVLNSTTTGSAAATLAVAEWPGSSRRHKVDLSGAKQARVICRVSTPWSAATKVAIQWSTDEVTWFYLSGTANGSAPIAAEYVSGAATATLASAWNTLPAAAKADVVIRGVTLDGDGTTAGAGGTLSLQFR